MSKHKKDLKSINWSTDAFAKVVVRTPGNGYFGTVFINGTEVPVTVEGVSSRPLGEHLYTATMTIITDDLTIANGEQLKERIY